MTPSLQSTYLPDEFVNRAHVKNALSEAFSAGGGFRNLALYGTQGTGKAQTALAPQSLHRNALNFIAASTTNLTYALQWLKTAAQEADGAISKATVKRTYNRAFEEYVATQLQQFTDHHRTLYTAIKRLAETDSHHFQTGDIYHAYSQCCESAGKESLSDRRVSDLLKHLEYLGLITTEYHYGGSTGKTRKIQLQKPV